MKYFCTLLWGTLAAFFGACVQVPMLQAQTNQSASVVSFYGYDDCIELRNKRTTVTLCPAAGGRVLRYALAGKNILALPPGEEGWRLGKSEPKPQLTAGRFDIGPEKMVKRGVVLWQGEWRGEITGDGQAKLTSQYDPMSGARLIRNFKLDRESTHLVCTQTIVNESDRAISLCHWSRTFAIGGGVAILPRSSRGRFPNGYVMYESGRRMDFIPEDPAIQVTEEAVMVMGPPKFPKLGFDSYAGWMAYAAPNHQLFVKRYPTYPDRAYNEVAGLTASIYYPQNLDIVEVEPIGPAANLAPGEQASFTEHWYLADLPFPSNVETIEYQTIKQKVDELLR